MATKKIIEPKINAELLRRMQEIYREYTGQQVADVIGYIRARIEREEEELFLEQEIERLTARLAASRQEAIE